MSRLKDLHKELIDFCQDYRSAFNEWRQDVENFRLAPLLRQSNQPSDVDHDHLVTLKHRVLNFVCSIQSDAANYVAIDKLIGTINSQLSTADRRYDTWCYLCSGLLKVLATKIAIDRQWHPLYSQLIVQRNEAIDALVGRLQKMPATLSNQSFWSGVCLFRAYHISTADEAEACKQLIEWLNSRFNAGSVHFTQEQYKGLSRGNLGKLASELPSDWLPPRSTISPQRLPLPETRL